MERAMERAIEYLMGIGQTQPCKRCVNCADNDDVARIAEYGCPYVAEAQGCLDGMTAYFKEHPEA